MKLDRIKKIISIKVYSGIKLENIMNLKMLTHISEKKF
jgi:hypothetical protein